MAVYFYGVAQMYVHTKETNNGMYTNANMMFTVWSILQFFTTCQYWNACWFTAKTTIDIIKSGYEAQQKRKSMHLQLSIMWF